MSTHTPPKAASSAEDGRHRADKILSQAGLISPAAGSSVSNTSTISLSRLVQTTNDLTQIVQGMYAKINPSAPYGMALRRGEQSSILHPPFMKESLDRLAAISSEASRQLLGHLDDVQEAAQPKLYVLAAKLETAGYYINLIKATRGAVKGDAFIEGTSRSNLEARRSTSVPPTGERLRIETSPLCMSRLRRASASDAGVHGAA